MDILNKPEFQVGGEHPDRSGFFAFPGAIFRGGAALSQVECTYYGIAPGKQNSPYIERGREEGLLGFTFRRATTRAIGLVTGGSLFSAPWAQKALCPTIRYVYVKNQQSAYLKHSHPKVTTASLDIPRNDERYSNIEYGELYADWHQTSLEEQNFGEFTEVTETFKFSNVIS